jgi:hypothetical protein
MKVSIGKYPKKDGKQKVSVCIDPWDTWNMDATLALIIHPMLKQLKKTKHGAPYTDDEDVPEHLRSTAAKPKKNDWDVDSNHFKRWDWVLSEMIWAFGEEVKDKEPNFWIEKPKWNKDGIVKNGKLDKEKMDKYFGRKKNAFRLFGKYYGNLWD